MPLSAGLVFEAYVAGIFPMARPDGVIEWWRPDPRAVIPLDGLRVSASLARVVRGGRFAVEADTAFEEVMRACADRPATWISEEIIACYTELHARGLAHSVECRDESGSLVGGLYGVAIGGAFFGESMFSRARDASKVALVHLVRRLRAGGFTLLDVQFQTDHLARLGAIEIPAEEYEGLLDAAVRLPADWAALDRRPAPDEAGTDDG